MKRFVISRKRFSALSARFPASLKRFPVSRFLPRLIGCLLILYLFALVPAFAAETGYVFTDGTGPLSEGTFAALDQRAAEISETYGFGVYLAVVNNYEDYGFDDVYDCAVQFYEESDLGYGDERDGELLFMSMSNRRFATVYTGYGETAFTERGRDVVQDAFLSRFRDDDWYGGFSAYLDRSEYVLSIAASGTPLGWEEYGSYHPNYSESSNGETGGHGGLFGLLITAAASGGLSGLVCAGFMGEMKSVRSAVQASQYAVKGSLKLRVKEDRFTHTTESRVKVKSESSSDSGGSISHHSGGGHSGRSGGF